MTDYRKTLAERVRKLRQARRISASKLSRTLGLSRTHITAIETKGMAPSLDVLCKIAEFLDCTPDYLLGFSDQVKPVPNIQKLWPEGAELLMQAYTTLDKEEKKTFLIGMKAFLLHLSMMKGEKGPDESPV
ncbi:MAG: helix-turn-helix domain-containing protein [Desulfotomaculales bacterium]